MLQGVAIGDAVHRGLGLAARAVGQWCDLFRPRGPHAPLALANRVARLPAAFFAPSGAQNVVAYGSALRHGVFDSALARVGDYLRSAEDVFFIIGLPQFGPALCVKTNRVISFSRPTAPRGAGLGDYSGVQKRQTQSLMRNWPVSALLNPRDGGRGALPGDAPGVAGGAGGWEVLLPAIASVTLLPGDLAQDDIGRTGVVASSELTQLGWRLLVRQAGS